MVQKKEKEELNNLFDDEKNRRSITPSNRDIVEEDPSENSENKWKDQISRALLALFAGVTSTGILAGMVEVLLEISLPFSNPVIRGIFLVLVAVWWKLIGYWSTD
jgi:hypothetical protein